MPLPPEREWNIMYRDEHMAHFAPLYVAGSDERWVRDKYAVYINDPSFKHLELQLVRGYDFHRQEGRELPNGRIVRSKLVVDGWEAVETNA